MAYRTIFLNAAIMLLMSSSVFGFAFEKIFMGDPIYGEDSPSDQALFLSKYIETGEIEKARQLSRVKDLPNAPAITSYSGFFTVNTTYNSNIFFWFVPAMDNNKKAPVILWLQGGPGTSGLFGLFVEHGPYVIDSKNTASLRDESWTKNFNVIYVDNPVGTGFSFTEDLKGFATNQDEMADNMYKFMQQFYTVFYEYKKNDLYVVGESYGGKYAPSLAYKIHSEGKKSNINLKGIAVGNGMCDPESMMDYSHFLYELGLVDRNQARLMRNLSDQIVKHIRNKEYYEALVEMDKLIIDFNVLPYTSYFKNFTDFNFYYNLLLSRTPRDMEYYKSYVNLPQVKKAINVGNSTYHSGEMAQKNLLLDIMQSVKPKVEVLMDNYRVLFYNGQLDLIIPYTLTVNFLHQLNWKHKWDYKSAERQIWKLPSGGIAGYVHNVKDFYEVLVRDAGHIAPYDQPKLALDLISRFVTGKSFA